jgi:tetratricopeptide (TPR) repeat protein
MYVYQSTLFTSVPLQAVVDAFLIGRSVGERSGNLLYTYLNHASAVGVSYWAGANLLATTKEIHDVQQRGNFDAWTKNLFVYLQDQCNAIQHGGDEDSLECILELVSTSIDSLQQMNRVVFTMQRLFLFRRVDIITLDVTSTFSQDMKNGKHILRPVLLAGMFLSGLIAFQSARRATDKESQEEWYERGVYSTKTLMSFSVHSSWNWENKALLLSAEKLYTDGDFDSAASIYDKAICSANEHRFVHEEAIASELAGDFYYNQNFQEKSMSFFKHSLKCYLKWGATAVAKRLQNDLEVKFGLNEVQNMPNNNLMEVIYSLKEQSLSRKWCESFGGIS